MTILKDLLSIKEATKPEQASVEMGLAFKFMAEAIKKGYSRAGAINYTSKLVKSQGFSEDYSKQCAERAWEDLATETVNEDQLNEAMSPEDIAHELTQYYEDMTDIMANIKKLMRQAPGDIRQHAEHYWIPAIITALGSEHDYMGGTSKYDTLQATVHKLLDEE